MQNRVGALAANAVSGCLFCSIRLLFFCFLKNVQPAEEKINRYCMGYIDALQYVLCRTKIPYRISRDFNKKNGKKAA